MSNIIRPLGREYGNSYWIDVEIKRIKDESRQPNILYFVPHIVPIIRNYRTKHGEHAVLNNVEDLYNWYYSFVKDIDKDTDTKELHKIALEITDSCTTEFEKVEKITRHINHAVSVIHDYHPTGSHH